LAVDVTLPTRPSQSVITDEKKSPERVATTLLRAKAVSLGNRIDLQRLEGDRLAAGSMLMRAGARGSAVVFRYGCVVLFDTEPGDEQLLLETLKPALRDPVDQPQVEVAELSVTGAAGRNGEISIPDRSKETLLVIADVLAESVALAQYEASVADAFDSIEPLAVELERKGRVDRRSSKLVRQIASTLLTEQRVVGRIGVGEKPDVLWDAPYLERLHALLVDEYELKDRQAALERKLALISGGARLLLELHQDRRSLRVEWYIVLLIVFEILISIGFAIYK
jgi:uncharacterized Rmd1/YagE family protein